MQEDPADTYKDGSHEPGSPMPESERISIAFPV